MAAVKTFIGAARRSPHRRCMNADERFEELERVIADLAEKNDEAAIIVEGERDVRALRALGVSGRIVTLHRGVSVLHLCERLAADHRPVVILTDWDVRGGQLARLLRDGLAANGVPYDDEFRARLAALTAKEIKAVEDLHRHVENLRPRGANGRRRIRSNRAWYSERSRRP